MNYQYPFVNPYMQPYQQVQQMPAAGQQVTRVNGENGARAYQIGANSSALLLDESGTMVWMITTDGAGYKTVMPYDVLPHKTQEEKTYGDLESRIRKLEEMMGGRKNDTSNTTAAHKEPGESD